MRYFKDRRQDLILVGALILFSLTLMTLQMRHKGLTTPIERAVVATFGPLQSWVHKPLTAFRRLTSNLASVESLRKTNHQLQGEVQRLRGVETAYQELRLRHERVRRLLQFRQQLPFKTVAASVIARDATNWSKTVTLDVGSQWGIREDLPVLNHEGIVGHIIRVAPQQSQVLLITDVRGAVDALIQRTRAGGVFVGSSNGNTRGYLKYVPREADVRVSDQIISSGYGGIYPKGILLGVVKSVDRSGTDLFQSIEVESAVDFSRLEEVIVVVEQQPHP
ncbi:MAG: rod shape-determining protein MreC [Nitrospinota bacterium]